MLNNGPFYYSIVAKCSNCLCEREMAVTRGIRVSDLYCGECGVKDSLFAISKPGQINQL